ncbi:MAG: hypothetical protein GT589_05175 [Peptoclostridium sp.]|uniref:hypothetical protein n=1 Tax=Peptoclostridium sp. TaxID=1904860 RepID=UPI00139B4845|nr:hypothetical protein [Peptoclostridium sp.]MZQ75535.1 hypothetical protein [Peptoclostridium sp.]
MKIEVCKWYGNADSPVLLWIDDLANAWVDVSGSGSIELGEDWGYAKHGENSSFDYLEQKLLLRHPKIKTTFFVPVGKRSGVVSDSSIKVISEAINSDEETKAFFRNIGENPKFEMAYHGTTHGIAREKMEDFVQEWSTFESLEEALETIEKGRSIFYEVFGFYPKGGKYCGYEPGKYGDESIDRSGFFWWCRHSNVDLIEYGDSEHGGSDKNPLTSYDIKTFGKNGVIDIPTTIGGHMLNRYLNKDERIIKGTVKRLLRRQLIEKEMRKIDYLIKNKLLISIEEHISPARNDGRRQLLNIFDDMEGLNEIFDYISGKNVWYCTGSELAEYYYCRENSVIEQSGDEFAVKFKPGNVELSSKFLSLKVEGGGVEKLILPNGKEVSKTNGVFNIEIMDGVYKTTELK